jgi:MFS family permease
MTAPESVTSPIARMTRVPLFSPLAGRDFRLVWFGESVSLFGDQFHIVALSWLVLGLTGSGLALGSILLAAAIPRGIFVLVGGVLSDRVSPRMLALGSNLLRAAVTTVVAALVLGARIELYQLALAGIVFGTVDAVFFPAINTLVPRLVPADRLAAANAVMQGTGQLAATIGPALAGFAIAIIGVGAAFAIDALSFLVAAIALWLVRGGATAGTPADETLALSDPDPSDALAAIPAARPSLGASLREGTRAVLGDPVMRMIVLLVMAINLGFTGPVVVGLPWLVLVHFGGDALALGLVFAAWGLGSLVGVVLAGSLPRPARFGWVLLGILIGMGIGLGAIGLAPSVAAAGLIGLGIGVGNGYANVVMIAWVQERTEPHLLGRTLSFVMLGSVIAAPLSLALAGALVDTRATAMFLAAGVLVVVAAVAGIVSGLPRRMA